MHFLCYGDGASSVTALVEKCSSALKYLQIDFESYPGMPGHHLHPYMWLISARRQPAATLCKPLECTKLETLAFVCRPGQPWVSTTSELSRPTTEISCGSQFALRTLCFVWTWTWTVLTLPLLSIRLETPLTRDGWNSTAFSAQL